MVTYNCLVFKLLSAGSVSSIYKTFINKLNKKMRAQGMKILLFVDNAPSHPHSLVELSNTKVIFFPPSATSVLQQLDMGIIDEKVKNVLLKYSIF